MSILTKEAQGTALVISVDEENYYSLDRRLYIEYKSLRNETTC